jgi:23S rRNA pseudouridine1911/1915/1917 synthase
MTAQPISIPIVYEDNHLLVVNKPAGVVSQGARESDVSVLRELAEFIRTRDSKPGNVYLGVVSRLDKPTSGLLPIAKTSKAAARLSEQIRNRKTEKYYLALVEGVVQNETGNCHDMMETQTDGRRIRIQSPQQPTSKNAKLQSAELSYHRLLSTHAYSLLAIELKTGRKHQIRVQLSAMGHPVVGDKKYGATTQLKNTVANQAIGLHCHRIIFEHPTKRSRLTFTQPPPDYWNATLPGVLDAIDTPSITSPDHVEVSRVISGGQTGVDRAALDVAIALKIPHGGWCPKGRLAEDGPIDEQYQLIENESKDYAVRTRQNVIDSDGTLILIEEVLQGGTRLTQRIANQLNKPCLCLRLVDDPQVDEVLSWMEKNAVRDINIAGPRGSHSETIYSRANVFCQKLFTRWNVSTR